MNICVSCAASSSRDIIHRNGEIPNSFQKDNIIKWEDTTKFVPPINGGMVIKVYDGDTITVASYLNTDNKTLYRFSVRLNGIDSPELKSNNEEEKIAAKISQKALEDLLLHKYVVLKNINTEKYGRILADVYLNDTNINSWLLEKCYAVPYDGGTKKGPKNWIKYQATGSYE
jgi:endonuclease YncB( thermonuclease family)